MNMSTLCCALSVSLLLIGICGGFPAFYNSGYGPVTIVLLATTSIVIGLSRKNPHVKIFLILNVGVLSVIAIVLAKSLYLKETTLDNSDIQITAASNALMRQLQGP